MGLIYLWFENRTFFRSDLCKNRRPIYHILAYNYYVGAFKVKKNLKKPNNSQLFAS